jgi:SAM-dependent methyltransferase
VLDCACGTGQHLPLFHSLGNEVVGSDVSTAMLAQARKNLAGAGLDIPIHQVDYRELPQHYFAPEDAPFDAVTCLSSSILHMPDDDGSLRALCSMRDVLREGGILVLTQGTSDRQWAEKPRFILVSDTPEFTRLFVIDYTGRGARYNIVDIWHGDDARGKGRGLQVWGLNYPHVLLRDDHERLLKAAGFREVEFYGGYDFEPYDRTTSQRLITVARK